MKVSKALSQKSGWFLSRYKRETLTDGDGSGNTNSLHYSTLAFPLISMPFSKHKLDVSSSPSSFQSNLGLINDICPGCRTVMVHLSIQMMYVTSFKDSGQQIWFLHLTIFSSQTLWYHLATWSIGEQVATYLQALRLFFFFWGRRVLFWKTLVLSAIENEKGP